MSPAILRNLAVLTKELRTRMRGRRAAVVITVYLLLLSSVAGLMLYGQQRELQSGLSLSAAPTVGLQLFVTLSQFQLFLVVFIVPGLTGAAIAGERDRQTLDWVGTTPPMAGMLRLVCAIPPTEPDVPLSRHPALPQMG